MGLDVEKMERQGDKRATAHNSTAGCGPTLPLQQQQQQHSREQAAPQHNDQQSISGAAASQETYIA